MDSASEPSARRPSATGALVLAALVGASLLGAMFAGDGSGMRGTLPVGGSAVVLLAAVLVAVAFGRLPAPRIGRAGAALLGAFALLVAWLGVTVWWSILADRSWDAFNKGVIDSGQWWKHYATGKHPAGGLFSAPLGGSGSGLDQMGQLAWYMRGGGRDLYLEYYQKMLRADVMPFLYAPDGPECFGWFKKPITSVAEFTKLRFRISSGLPATC